MHSDRDGQPYDADLVAAVTEPGDALRELVRASVRMTVPAPGLRAAAAEARAAAPHGRPTAATALAGRP